VCYLIIFYSQIMACQKSTMQRLSEVSAEFSAKVKAKSKRSQEKITEQNRLRKKARKQCQGRARAERENEKKLELEKWKELALKYTIEKERADKLEKENEGLIRQLQIRKFSTRKGVNTMKNKVERSSEFLASQLNGCAEVNPSILERSALKLGSGSFGNVYSAKIKTLDLEVAVKTSKKASLETEGRVYQALSGNLNFLHFFGMCGNTLVLERVCTDDNLSSTLDYMLSNKVELHSATLYSISGGIVNGIIKMHGLSLLHNDIKENNILIKQGAFGQFTPKVFDFGKVTHQKAPLVYELEKEQSERYNKLYRHLAPELRNGKGSRQSMLTDAYSVGRVLKQIARIHELKRLMIIAYELKNSDPKLRKSLTEVNLFES